jgi:hypothetical protein
LGRLGALSYGDETEMTLPNYSPHPLSLVFPFVVKEALKALTVDISRRGLQEPVVVYQNRVLDGRARYMICGTSGFACRFTEYEGDEPLRFVIEKNLASRNCTLSQRAVVAAEISTSSRGKGQTGTPLRIAGFTYTVFANLLTLSTWFDVSPRSIKSARVVLASDDFDLIAGVERGKVSISAAERLVRKPQ